MLRYVGRVARGIGFSPGGETFWLLTSVVEIFIRAGDWAGGRLTGVVGELSTIRYPVKELAVNQRQTVFSDYPEM